MVPEVRDDDRPAHVLTCVHVIVVAAVVPNPPLLVPELVGGAVAETAPLRAACEAAARQLAAAGARRWVAVAAHADGPRRVPPTATGTFAGFGVDVPVALGPSGDERCPMDQLPMLVAGWLRGQASALPPDVTAQPPDVTAQPPDVTARPPEVAVTGELLAPSTSAAACAGRGAALVGELDGEPVGLLVLGDGARSHPAPGAGLVDVRAGPFDETVRDALATADTGALLDLDEQLAAELGATGRPAWQLLAGAVERTAGPWRAELLYSAAPYGIAYHVAVWRPA